MRFGLLVNDRKIELVRGFVAAHPEYVLGMVEIGGGTFVALQREYESLDEPGAVAAVNSMLYALSHINDVEKSISILDIKAGTAESNIEHIRRLHRELAAGGTRSVSLAVLRPEGGLDQEIDA